MDTAPVLETMALGGVQHGGIVLITLFCYLLGGPTMGLRF
jgi:hypothetical protein